MSKPQPVKRAVLKGPDKTDTLFLFRVSKGDYRWVFPADGKEFNGVAYLSEDDAIRALRVSVDGEPEFVGWDLTIYPVDPPPEERAAKRCVTFACEPGPWSRAQDEPWAVDRMREIIREETRVDELLDAYQTLLAFLFQRREAYAKALFPTIDGQKPRDITLDGLLLNCIEATEKATLQSHENMKAVLKQPVSRIITAQGTVKKGPVQ